MKLTMKIFLVISLFCSTALADGDIKHGQRDDDDGSGGGLACVECVIDDQAEKNEDDSIVKMIQDFFGKILG